MELKNIINVGIVDSCKFTAMGLERLINSTSSKTIAIKTHNFTHLDEIYKCDMLFDMIIYDPLNTRNFLVNVDMDINILRKRQTFAKIYIYSTGVGFIKMTHVDGMFNKLISLPDLKALWQMAMNKLLAGSGGLNDNFAFTCNHRASCLTNEEVSVLRGYACNLKTKQIASVLGCSVKLIYLYKKNAISKLEASRGPGFYQRIRCILN
ncbi:MULTISPECIES: LuxR C-terminal-related transcriptional regulator [Tenebrionibacter/Tenebrionicola group]|jgi:DNA-binding NarL/FixJ family response regulator|uniref:DNA-binding response regulator n=2 Tax=Tenebrionibacter/Tenebrionicola group TaxID=2969848 RepID=A0A8K0V1P8_9ENTR|nr:MULTISPECIES: LuxR C-terminal-related transcriptional regulator [Tenebrionibacter/Tenebrionicola group]MBK4715106.1 DNA-binding response regulator [Tenebrionibacter intestinalis]MBV4414020.1 DNA-binding response regulator [Tenebrionicola larvae]MBV5096234.1 DNA-binding response regulator [Tenebrionicola larvae]